MSAGAAESRPENTEINASKTGLALESSLGPHGNLRLRGRQERLGAAQSEYGSTASQRAATLSVDMGYDTGDASHLAMTAHFNQTDYGLAAGPIAERPMLQQEQRNWGYDASWTKQLDPASRVAVAVGVIEASVAGSSNGEAATPADRMPPTAPGSSGAAHLYTRARPCQDEEDSSPALAF